MRQGSYQGTQTFGEKDTRLLSSEEAEDTQGSFTEGMRPGRGREPSQMFMMGRFVNLMDGVGIFMQIKMFVVRQRFKGEFRLNQERPEGCLQENKNKQQRG